MLLQGYIHAVLLQDQVVKCTGIPAINPLQSPWLYTVHTGLITVQHHLQIITCISVGLLQQ